MQNSWDNTGVGGNFNTFNPVTQDLIVDSLKYWKDELGVDGFRFDLASVLGNTCQHGCFNYDKTEHRARRSTASGATCPRARPPAAPARTSSPSRGPSVATATRWATSPAAGPSGTASTATPSARTRTSWAWRR